MTMIEEDQLRALLDEAAETLHPSPDAPRRVLDSARASLEAPRVPRPVTVLRGHKVRVALATAAVLLAVMALALSFSSPAPGGLSAHGLTPSPPLATTSSRDAGYGDHVQLGAASGMTNGSGYRDVTPAGRAVPTEALGANGPTGSTGATGATGATDQGTVPAKVVAVGQVTLGVAPQRVRAAVDRLSALARGAGGYVASSTVHAGSPGTPATATVVLRVPEPRFDAVVTAVERVGNVTQVSTSSTDVTAQYVDYQAHISALEQSRAQYLAILAKATTIGQILAVQAQVNQIQTQIDELKGQRNVLANEAAYGTLTVALDPGQGPASVHESGLHRSFRESVGGFVSAFEDVVRAAGPTLFVLLCLGVLFLIGQSLWRVGRRRLI